MEIKLTITGEVEGREKTWELVFDRELISIGSHSLNDVQIPVADVAAEHARIVADGGREYLVDLGSELGTELNGKRAVAHDRLALTDGDTITISGYRILVGRPVAKPNETTSEKTSMVAMQMVRDVLGGLANGEAEAEKGPPPSVEVRNDSEAGTRLDFPDDREYTVGRERSSDLVLSHWSISRRHAMFRREGAVVTVLDLGSKNGVMVNGERMTSSRRLRDGDTVHIGHTELSFKNPMREPIEGLDVSRPAPERAAPPPEPPKPAAPPPAAPPRPHPEPPPAPPPPRYEAPPPSPRYEAPAAPPPPAPPPAPDPDPDPSLARRPEVDSYSRRPRPADSSFADYLPMIIGGVLILAAIVAGIFLFVLG